MKEKTYSELKQDQHGDTNHSPQVWIKDNNSQYANSEVEKIKEIEMQEVSLHSQYPSKIPIQISFGEIVAFVNQRSL